MRQALMFRCALRLLAPCLCLCMTSGCRPEPAQRPPQVTLERQFRSDDVPGCFLASPIAIRSRGERFVLSPGNDGLLRAYDPASGALRWSVSLPVPAGRVANVTAPPVAFDEGHLVVAFQHTFPRSLERDSHRVVVVDLEARALDPGFPELTLAARRPDADGGGEVAFLAQNAFSRSPLVHAAVPDRTRGLVYVSFGNVRDIQPWHGWVFELDLDRWRELGVSAAVSGVLLTTAENDCGIPGDSGSEDMICGAGVWAPAGPQLRPRPGGGYELLVPTGNGALDPLGGEYANTLMRTGRGLGFDPACDLGRCAGWDPTAPAEACMASCRDLFIPRLLPGEPPLTVSSGRCDGLSFFECYAVLDWDLGANSPTLVRLASGREVAVLPAKDGAVYLFDADHFGTMYDRVVVAEPCGAPGDPCGAQWAGMMATQPLLTEIDGAQVVLVVTFQFDRTHPAGVVALRVRDDAAGPRLERLWTTPAPGTPESLSRFRRHPGRLALVTLAGERFAAVVDVGAGGTPGMLHLVRVRDGAVAARAALDGHGQRFVLPLVLDDTIYVHSCVFPGDGAGHLEAYRLVVQTEGER